MGLSIKVIPLSGLWVVPLRVHPFWPTLYGPQSFKVKVLPTTLRRYWVVLDAEDRPATVLEFTIVKGPRAYASLGIRVTDDHGSMRPCRLKGDSRWRS